MKRSGRGGQFDLGNRFVASKKRKVIAQVSPPLLQGKTLPINIT